MATCLGLDRETVWRNVRAGRCGMCELTAMEQPLAPGKLGGQCPDLPADEEAGRPREVRYLRRVLLDALRDAGIDPANLPYPKHRCGLMIGTTLHGMRAGGEYLRSNDAAPLRHFLASGTLRSAARELGFEGFAATTCSACSSSLGSVALGVSLLQSGQLDVVVAGGYDPISEYVYGGFNSLRLVAEGPLRPFGKNREGMKLAEGYAIVVLEREADARRRGHAGAVARVLGFGESADAHHLTQPHPQGDGAARAIAGALAAAGLTPEGIDLVAAHATGTPDNDTGEFAALSRVFGDRLKDVPVVGFKSHLGHTLGGAGAVELILSAMALRDGVVPPCASVKAEEVEFAGLNLSTGSETPAPLRATLNTSLGFGGANTCVVLGPATPSSRYAGERAGERGSCEARGPSASADVKGTTRSSETDSADAATLLRSHDASSAAEVSNVPRPPREPLSPTLSPVYREEGAGVFITGVGVVLPGAVGNDAFVARLASPTRVTDDTGPLADEAYLHLLNARRVRRMSEYVKLSLAATAVAFADAGIADIPAFSATCAAMLGSAHGSANYSKEYYRQIVDEGIPAANPMLFAEGVPNAAAAHLSLMMQLKGACQTIIGTRTAGLDALRLAAMRIAAGTWDRAVVSAGEEFSPTVNAAYRHCGVYAGANAAAPFTRGDGFASGCGAVTFILESARSLQARGGRARGVVLAAASAAPGEGGEAAAADRVLAELGDPRHVLASANGTWIDRVESAALRHSARRAGHRAVVSSPYGHLAETFSVNALAGIAAVLLTGHLPALLGPAPAENDIEAARQADHATVTTFAALSTDYTGLISAVKVGRATAP
jgi:3-oxoacyl-[acyl-carrier-protein] synthase II